MHDSRNIIAQRCLSGRSLLIADDDEDVRAPADTLSSGRSTARSSIARDGEEALAIAQARLPDLVLLDVMMPKRSGWEVCQALKAVQRTSQIAVVLVTGRGDVKDRLTGLQLGADDYLVKPFNRDEVVKRIGALLARKHREPAPPAPRPRKPSESMLFDRASGLPTVPMVLEPAQGNAHRAERDRHRLRRHRAVRVDRGRVRLGLLRRVPAPRRRGRRRRGAGALSASRSWPRTSSAARASTSSSRSRGTDLRQETAFDAIAERRRARSSSPRCASAFRTCSRDRSDSSSAPARIDYRPQIRLERQVYQGMQTAGDAVRDAEQQRKKQLTRELRDIIRRKRVTTLFQPIVWAQRGTVFGYEVLTRGAAELVVPQLRHALRASRATRNWPGRWRPSRSKRAASASAPSTSAAASSSSISKRRCSRSRSSASTRWCRSSPSIAATSSSS